MKMKTNFLIFLSLTITILFTSCFGNSKSEDNKLSYEGISLLYPSYWKAETEKLGEGSFYIDCSEKFSSNTIFLVSFVTWERDSEEIINNFIETLEEDFDVTREPFTTNKFGKYDCISVSYKMSRPGERAYGIVYAFNSSEKSMLVVKQSKREYDLKHKKYKLMEDSFNIENDEIGNEPSL